MADKKRVDEILGKNLDLKDYTPSIVRDSPQIEAQVDALNPQYRDAQKAISEFGLYFSPNLSNEVYIAKWERALSLHPATNDTIEDRRMRVLIALNEKKPITKVRLHRLMAALCGQDKYHFEIKNLIGHFELYDVSNTQALDVYDMLARLLPMNILYDITTNTTLESDRVAVVAIERLNKIVDIPAPTKEASPLYVYGGQYITKVIDIPAPEKRVDEVYIYTQVGITQIIQV